MAAGDLITQDRQLELWRSDTDRILLGPTSPFYEQEIRGFATPAVRTSDVPRQQAHGDVAGSDRWEARQLEGEFEIIADPGPALQAALADLGRGFRVVRPGEADVTLVYKPRGAPKRILTGRPRGAEWPDNSRTSWGGAVPAGWRFYAPDPRWYSLLENSDTMTIDQGQSTVSHNIWNDGDTETYPILEIQGPATNPRIANQHDANRQLKIDITLAANETLIVDFSKRTVTLAGVDKAGNVRTDNQWFEILPGTNLLTYQRTGTTGVSNLKIRWRDAFATVGHPSLDLSTLGTMELDLDASKITALGTGGRLASWPDSSGKNRPATQADAGRMPWFSTRDHWIALPGTTGSFVSTPDPELASTKNRLTRNQATLESSGNNTEGWGNASGATLSRSAAQAAQGAASLALTTSVAGTISADTDAQRVPVTPNAQYTAVASFRTTSAVPKTCRILLIFRNAAGSGVGTFTGANVTVGNAGFVQASVTAIAPATAATAFLAVQGDLFALNDILYVDQASIHRGASTAWAEPAEDLDVRAKVSLDDWTPATAQSPINKWAQSASWLLWVTGSGRLRFYWRTPDEVTLNRESTVAVPVADGGIKWVRVRFDADNGAGGHDVAFDTSDDGVTWTQLGGTVTTAGVTAIKQGLGPIQVGFSDAGNADGLIGKAYAAEIFRGLTGAPVRLANPAFERNNDAAGFFDDVGNFWTLAGAAAFATGPVRRAEVFFDGLGEFLDVAATTGYRQFLIVAEYARPTFKEYDGLVTGKNEVATEMVLRGAAGAAHFHYDPAGRPFAAYKDGDFYAQNVVPGPMQRMAVYSIHVTGADPWMIAPRIGAGMTGINGRTWHGRILRVIGYSTVLSDVNRQRAMAELRRQHGLI